MEARPESLYGMLSSAKRFLIPEYQRPYVWTKEDVERLWDDLWGDFLEDHGEPDSSAPATPSDPYFLGPVVVANLEDKDKAKLSYVVDGQQRLTTLHSLLWIMHNRLRPSINESCQERVNELNRVLTMPNGNSLLKVAGRDEANYTATVRNSVLDERTSLGIAVRYLREMTAERTEQEIDTFARFLLHKTRFVFVQTDSFSSAWELFIGLNGKGRPLNPADLIKAYICGRSPDSEAVANIWEGAVLPLGNDATSAILDTVRMSTGEVGTEASLFRMVEDAWKNRKIDADLLRLGCGAYYQFWIQTFSALTGIDATGTRALYSLRALKRRDIMPVLIALAQRYGFVSLFDTRLLQLLNAYQLWMAICSKRGRERDFTDLAHKISSSQGTLETTLGQIAELLKKLAPTEDTVRNAVRLAAYPGRVLLHIVKSYEEGMRGGVTIEDVWYEHIMPLAPTDFWFAAAGTTDQNMYARIVNNIGNVTPLDPATNIKGRNDPWETKRKLFLEFVPNWLAAEIARQNPEKWTPAKIEQRRNKIADWCIQTRWPLTKLLGTTP